MNTRDALEMVLSYVDWTRNGCNPSVDEPVCSALPQEVIKQARKALDEAEDLALNEKLSASIKRNAAQEAS